MSEADCTNDGMAFCLFDGVCGLCSWSVQFVLRRERKPTITFVAIQSELGRQIAIRHGVDPDIPSTFLFVENGCGYAKSDGIIAIARHLRWPWRALRWYRFLPLKLRDRLYDLIAVNRYRIFGQLDKCMMPPEDVRIRFVLPDQAPNQLTE
ncbi:MAG: thiol-disulfide oxidoreductase DCC family protein [Pseudomonadota bacterium]